MTSELGRILLDAADGRFPVPDGRVTVLPPDEATGLEAVFSFTAHAVIATCLPLEVLLGWGADGYGGADSPDVLRGIAGPTGTVGVLDVMLVARGTGAGPGSLRETDEHDHLHRVEHARHVRLDVRVLGDDRGFITLGRGVGGRTELGYEVHEGLRERGLGRAILRDALGAVPAGQPLFAACSPGNARSLRALLAVGFTPIGAEVLIRPAR